MKLVIQLLLWVVIIFLGYMVFQSVYGPVQFNEEKEKRYAKVIENLKDIRDSEMAYREVTGGFAGDWNSLVQFIDTAQFTLTQRKDTVVADLEYQKIYGVDRNIEIVVIDTLGYVSVKDSLFGTTNRYKTMMNVPIEGVDAQFELDAGTLDKSGNLIPVFEAKVDKAVVLQGLDNDQIIQEKQVISVDQVNGKYIQVGSMSEVKTGGNWPITYGDSE